jgi:hypothetical protein
VLGREKVCLIEKESDSRLGGDIRLRKKVKRTWVQKD